MKPITEVLHDKAWQGKRAFVVGSGPSLRGFDFALLHGEKTIGVNMEFGWGPTVALCQDPRIWADGYPGVRLPLREDPQWTGGPHTPVVFQGHPDGPDWTGPDSVALVRSSYNRVDRTYAWCQTLSEGLYYGANAGMAAINLAEILGADPILLLGFDARAVDGATHHHQAYPKDWCMQDRESREAVYGLWIKEFRKIAQMVRARVINLSPDSGIDAFPKGPAPVMLRGELNGNRTHECRWFCCLQCGEFVRLPEQLQMGVAICTPCQRLVLQSMPRDVKELL